MTTKSVNTLSMYRPSIRMLYKSSPTNWDIGTWVNLVGKHVSFIDHDDIYEPIELRIKVAGRLGSANGMVTMQVDPTDTAWYQTLRTAIAEGMQISKADIPYTTLHNMRGDDIAEFDPHTLHHVGELTVRVRGKQRKVGQVFTPAANVRPDKVNDLVTWYEDDVREKVIDHVASHLVGSSIIELDTKTRRGAPLLKEIQAIVEESVPGADMDRFMKLYGVNDRARNTPGADVAARIARSIASQLRKGIKANHKRIADYHSAQAARRAAQKAAKEPENTHDDDESSIDQPLFGNDHIGKADVTPVTYQDTENDRTLYGRIVRNALERPDHSSMVVYMVYRGRPTRYADKVESVGDKTNAIAPVECHARNYGHSGYHDRRRHRHGDDRRRRHEMYNYNDYDADRYESPVQDNDDDDVEDQDNSLAPYYDDVAAARKLTAKDQQDIANARRLQQFSGRHIFMKPAQRKWKGRQVTLGKARAPTGRAPTSASQGYDPLNAPVPAAAPLYETVNRHSSPPPFERYAQTGAAMSSSDEEDVPEFIPYAQSKATATATNVDDLFVPWTTQSNMNARPTAASLNNNAASIERAIDRNEKQLDQKLFTGAKKTLSNGMPSIFAFMNE